MVMTAPPDLLAPASPTPELVDALPLPPRLFVPVPSPEGCLPPGSRVGRGDVLISIEEATTTLPLAPVAGTVVGLTHIQRVGIGSTSALVLDVDATAEDSSGVGSPPSPASTQPPPQPP